MRVRPPAAMSLRRRAVWIGRRLAAACVCLALATSCEDSQSPPPPSQDGNFGGHYDPIAGGLEFRLLSPDGSATSLRLLASNLRYDDATQELAADVVLHNAGTNAVQGPPLVAIGDFDPSSVEPRNAQPLACPACVGCPCWPWGYDYSGTFGDDGTLEPGESSSPVEWVLFVPGRVSFSFTAILEAQNVPPPGTISGIVFADADRDGHPGPDEPGLEGEIVQLHHNDTTTSATTGADGRFSFAVTEAGLYVVERAASDACQPTTPLVRQVVIVARPDGSLSGYDRADFGCGSDFPLPILIRGVVFNDLDRNGERSPGEPGMPGVQITGSANQCPTFAPIVVHTGPDGDYMLVLPPCAPPYVVAREEIPGFVGTTPNPVFLGRRFPNEPPPGDPNTPPGGPGTPPGDPTTPGDPVPPIPPIRPQPFIVDFGVAFADSDTTRSAAIEGVVYRDTNSNGQRDPGEVGVPDIAVTAGGLGCAAPAIIVRTDANGHYRFEPGDVLCFLPWAVSHETSERFCDTTPNPVVLHHPVPPGGVYHVDFGIDTCNQPPPFGIGGVVWFDANRNGIRERDERGIAGAVLTVGTPCDVLIEAVTDAEGRYVFPPGSIPCPIYSVMQLRPEFPVHTTPNPYPVRPNSVPPGAMLTVDFGVFALRR